MREPAAHDTVGTGAPGAPRLLLAEDDEAMTGLLVRLLGEEGYAVEPAPDGHTALHRALTRRYDLMVIDRGLPAVEGVDLVRRLRAAGIATPVMVLTARGTTEDRVEGLDAGAEDYVVKPFEVEELLARLRALLRRHDDRPPVLDLGERHLDVAGRQVVGDDGAVPLSGRECALLQVFAAEPRHVFGREELRRRVFEDADGLGAVDTYVYYLRKKLGRDVVRTVRGLGYQMGRA